MAGRPVSERRARSAVAVLCEAPIDAFAVTAVSTAVSAALPATIQVFARLSCSRAASRGAARVACAVGSKRHLVVDEVHGRPCAELGDHEDRGDDAHEQHPAERERATAAAWVGIR